MSPSEHDTLRPDDDRLLQRYHEANALDTARPGEGLRASVLAQARVSAPLPGQSGQVERAVRPAANEPRWAVCALGSLAMLGLVGLLVLQFDRGTPEEKELALGAPPAASSTTPDPAPADTASAPSVPGVATESAVAPSTKRENETLGEPAASAAEPEVSAPPTAPMPEPAAATAPQAPAGAAAAEGSRSALQGKPVPANAAPPAPELQAGPRERRAAESTRQDGLLPPAPSPLWQAAAAGNADQVREAIARGDDLNLADARGRTALMVAAQRGDLAMVRLLKDAGADVAHTDTEGLSAADLARLAGHADVLEALGRKP